MVVFRKRSERRSETRQGARQTPLAASRGTHQSQVYQLVGSRWEDKGTAFCFGDVLDDGDARIVARAERDNDQIILSTIVRNDVYQRQQGARVASIHLFLISLACRNLDRLDRT